MTSMFRSSAELIDDITYRVLVYGPQGAGKSHFAHSSPDPAVIDFEHRSSAFRTLFNFKEVAPSSFREGLEAIREIAAGNVPCKIVVADSLTKPYNSLVRKFTSVEKSEKGKEYASTDWPAVNRLMGQVTDGLLSIPDKNVVAIARQNVRLERAGRDFKKAGVKMVGDEQRWPYDYDYVLHFASRGVIYVEKSMSVFVPVDSNIYGDLDWARFVRLITGVEPLEKKMQAIAGGRA